MNAAMVLPLLTLSLLIVAVGRQLRRFPRSLDGPAADRARRLARWRLLAGLVWTASTLTVLQMPSGGLRHWSVLLIPALWLLLAMGQWRALNPKRPWPECFAEWRRRHLSWSLPQGTELPLDEAQQSRLQALAARCGLPQARVSVMAAAGPQANARAHAHRLVLNDTLLKLLPPDEVEAVLAHEAAHVVLRHLRWECLLRAALWPGGVFLALQWAPAGDWVAAAWLAPHLYRLLTPLMLAAYRRWEFEADAFSAARTSAAALRAALTRLGQRNATERDSDAFYAALYETHPPLSERLNRLLRE